MALRYMLAMGIAYIVFLLLLWVWLRTSAADYLDLPAHGGTGGDTADGDFSGGGGSFDGGGASAHIDFSTGDSVEAAGGGPFEIIGHADEGAIPLAVILVDALLAAGLYRRLRVMDPRHWMVAALKRTLIPFILTTLTLGGAGWGMQAYAPAARSLGDVLASAGIS